MTADLALLSFGAGLLVAVLTAPVGISGAVLLLPVQLNILRIASPAVTPITYIVQAVRG